jgi:hypothetical protein
MMSKLSFGMSKEACQVAVEMLRVSSPTTSQEAESAPVRLAELIEALISRGENDPERAAFTALGLLRQEQQIKRSLQRLSPTSIPSPSIAA